MMLVSQQNKIIIVDIEATCWRRETPEGEQSEIIEVGLCVLDTEALTVSDKCSILVRPTRSKVSPFCTKLTTLTQAQVDAGVSFAEACLFIKDSFASEGFMWGSWGDYDHKMFRQQCLDFGVVYPFSEKHINLKALFAEVANNQQKVGMMRASKMIGYKPEGTYHRGVDDAWNTAYILIHLIRTYGKAILEPYW